MKDEMANYEELDCQRDTGKYLAASVVGII